MTIMFFVVYAGFIACVSFLIEATYRMNGARIAQRNAEWLPAPAKREADLRSTRHEEHAPTRFALAWCAALIAALGLYGYAYFAETLPAGQAVARMIGISGVLLLSVFFYRQVRRQPAQPGQRKVGIAVMVFCLLCLAGRIAQDFFGAPPINEVWFFFSFALSMQIGLAVATIRAIRQARAGRPGSAVISAP